MGDVDDGNVVVDVNHPLNGKKIVFTGIRNKDLEKKLKNIGVVIANKVNKDTFIVVTKNIVTGPLSSKLIDAKDLNINVTTIDEFIVNIIWIS